MLGFLSNFLRPTWALTALTVFGIWQGYSFWKGGTQQPEPIPQPQNVEQQAPELSEFAKIITSVHPGMRVISWIIGYGLFSLATIPLIRAVLLKESNAANAVMLIGYSAIGFLWALILTGFVFDWLSVLALLAALAGSITMIVLLAGKLEQLRVGGTMM